MALKIRHIYLGRSRNFSARWVAVSTKQCQVASQQRYAISYSIVYKGQCGGGCMASHPFHLPWTADLVHESRKRQIEPLSLGTNITLRTGGGGGFSSSHNARFISILVFCLSQLKLHILVLFIKICGLWHLVSVLQNVFAFIVDSTFLFQLPI